MTSKLKCPVCGKDLIPMTLSSNDNGTLYSSVAFPIKDCICNTSASKKIWQALIQAKQDLEQSEKCCSAWETQALDYKAETIALSGKLEIVKSYVKGISQMVINSGDNIYVVIGHFKKLADQTLKQIEHKE